MSNHVYKHIEVTGSSPKGIEDAVEQAIAKVRSGLIEERRFLMENGYTSGSDDAFQKVGRKVSAPSIAKPTMKASTQHTVNTGLANNRMGSTGSSARNSTQTNSASTKMLIIAMIQTSQM